MSKSDPNIEDASRFRKLPNNQNGAEITQLINVGKGRGDGFWDKSSD